MEVGHSFAATKQSFQLVLNDHQKDGLPGTYPIHVAGFQGLEISHTTSAEDLELSLQTLPSV